MAHVWLQRRNALFLLFFVVGVVMASWITRTPALRDELGVSISEMGMVLFGLSVGSMSGILVAGLAVRRHGTQAVARGGMLSIAAGLGAMAAGAAIAQPVVVAGGLAFIGAGMGLSEIAINVDGAHIESGLGKPVLHTLHGFFSLGTSAGALLGMWLIGQAAPVKWHLAAVAALAVPAILWAIRRVPAGYGKDVAGAVHANPHTGAARPQAVWRDRQLLLIGFIVLAMAFAEGSASDWLPLLMVDGHGFDQATGSSAFLAFALAMTTGRFAGGYFIGRFGRAAVLRSSAALGAAGLASIVFIDSQWVAGVAVILWGLGAALGFPVALSAAGDSGPSPAARVRVAATAGYVAFLVGPPMLGFVGEAVGLRYAMLIVLLLVVCAGAVAGAAGSATRHIPGAPIKS